MSDRALIVFTSKSVDNILKAGGSQSWVLDLTNMRDVGYVVCTRNKERDAEDGNGSRTEKHGEAFLVGKVSGIEPVETRNGRKRHIIKFSEYALVSVGGFWTGQRNPTAYAIKGTILHMGINIDELDFQPMPDNDDAMPAKRAREKVEKAGLTIAEAKEGLSAYFGVPIDSIQITISG
jgi:hypothetical protein